MALIKTWPANTEQGLDNKQWVWNEWPTGTPITQGKLENLENGVAILATQMSAILAEMDTATYSNLISNSSRLDRLEKEIGGTKDSTGAYSNSRIDILESNNTTNTNDISALKTRATNIESKNDEQDGKLTAIISEIGGSVSGSTYNGTSRIDSVATEVWGSNTTSGTSRIDKNDNKIAAIAAELGGTAPDGSSTTYGGTTRLDSVITEVWGSNTTSGDSRIDTLKSASDTHTNELTAIKNELGGTISGSTYGGTTRLDSVITKASSIAAEVWGTDTTSGDSRIDKLTTELYGSNTTNYDSTSRLDSAITKLSQVTTELYGSDNTSVTSRLDDLEKEVGGARTSNGTGYSNSRIDALESTSTSYGTRLNSIEDKNTAQDNKLAAIMNELGGTGNDGSNTNYGGTSRLDSAITEIWGSNTTSGNSRLDTIETHDASVDKAIAAIKNELGGTYVENSGFTNSRIDAIETLNTSQNNRLDTIEDLNTTQNTRLNAIETLNTTQNNRLTSLENRADGIETLNTTQNNKLDTLTTEIYGSNNTSIASRLDDLEKEVCGATITRTSDGTGYNNSRIDSLETKVGNGAIGTDSDISAAIRRLSDIVATLDPTGSAEATNFLVSEVWGQPFSEDTDFTANSRIDNLETTTQNLGTQLTTLATEQNELEQNLAATNTKIPIEMYVATNSSASDTIVLNAAPRDKSIFFIAIPRGTLGTNNLTLQTPDIQFNNVLINRIYNGNGMKIKYSAGSLISIYRNGSNAYAYNVPMVL